MFVGLVKCPDCGRNMAFSNPNGREPRFRCRTYARNSNLCTTHAISYDALVKIVMDDIQKHIKNMETLGDQFIEEMRVLSESGGGKKIKQFKQELELAEKRIAEIDSIIMKLFEQNPGGAPANLLTVASHMGYRTSFIGKVGKDMHGAFLKRTLQNEGIAVDHLIEDDKYFTTLAFVEIDENGERKFSFARKPGADTQLRKEELDATLLQKCKIFHFGSLSLTDEPAKSATLEAVHIAKDAGALISYDPNYRASLWRNEQTAVQEMKAVIPFADVMKVSDEESLLLTGKNSYEEAAEELLSMGPELIAITLGSDGVLVATTDGKEQIRGFATEAVDTTGAGDSFWGGFLSQFLSLHKAIDEMDWNDLRACARQGNAVACLCVQKRGGIPAIPDKKTVINFLNNQGKRFVD